MSMVQTWIIESSSSGPCQHQENPLNDGFLVNRSLCWLTYRRPSISLISSLSHSSLMDLCGRWLLWALKGMMPLLPRVESGGHRSSIFMKGLWDFTSFVVPCCPLIKVGGGPLNKVGGAFGGITLCRLSLWGSRIHRRTTKGPWLPPCMMHLLIGIINMSFRVVCNLIIDGKVQPALWLFET